MQDVSSELYGPMMLTLSLVAVLLYGMKSSGHEVVSRCMTTINGSHRVLIIATSELNRQIIKRLVWRGHQVHCSSN